jgi:hypothetical protein
MDSHEDKQWSSYPTQLRCLGRMGYTPWQYFPLVDVRTLPISFLPLPSDSQLNLSSMKLIGRTPPPQDEFVMDERNGRTSEESVQRLESLGEKRKGDL